MKTKKLLLLLFLFSAFYSYSQSLQNVDFKVEGHEIIINFEMIDFPSENNYDIAIMFSDSLNKLIIPESSKLSISSSDGLKKINIYSRHHYDNGLTIDAGKNTNINKQIRWNVVGDLRKLSGSYQLIVEVQSGYYCKGKKNTPEQQIKVEGRSGFKRVEISHKIPISVNYRNGIAINAEAVLIKDFKLTYTHKLYKGLYFESMVSYNFPLYVSGGSVSAILGSGYARDPYNIYGRFQVRVGLKLYFHGNSYIGFNYLYSYGHFNNGVVGYESFSELGNVLVNRVKNDNEILFKIGQTFKKKGFLIDIYTGLGIRLKYLDDTVYALSEDDDDPPTEYLYPGSYWGAPFHQLSNYWMPEIHLGLQIGFCR